MASITTRPLDAEGPPRVDFAANQDGPWPRSPGEFAAVMTRLMTEREVLARIRATDPGRPATPRLAHAEGVAAAATWTLAVTPKAPMTFMPRAVTDAGIRVEITAARTLIAEDDGRLRMAYARGVLAWFAWLATVSDTIPYDHAR